MDPASALILGGASLLGSLGGAGMQIAGAKKPSSSTHLAKLNLKYGKLYDEWAAKNLPTLNRAGMEAAGFNPILAINSGHSASGMANTPGHSAYDALGGAGKTIGDSVSNALNAVHSASQLDLMDAQKDLMNAQAAAARTSALRKTFGQYFDSFLQSETGQKLVGKIKAWIDNPSKDGDTLSSLWGGTGTSAKNQIENIINIHNGGKAPYFSRDWQNFYPAGDRAQPMLPGEY